MPAASESKTGSFQMRPGPPTEEAADDLWRRCQAAYPRGAPRDGAWLRWRFLDRPDVNDYVVLTLAQPSGRIAAWTVLRKQGDTMWVCDLVWDHQYPAALDALDIDILRRSRAAGAKANAMWLQGDGVAETIFRTHGWIRVPNPHRENLCFVVYDRSADFTELLHTVYLTLGDSDHV